jgi:hypothetical protein
MTVACVGPQNVDCVWFDGSLQKHAFFPIATIEPAPNFSALDPSNAVYDPLEQWRS